VPLPEGEEDPIALRRHDGALSEQFPKDQAAAGEAQVELSGTYSGGRIRPRMSDRLKRPFKTSDRYRMAHPKKLKAARDRRDAGVRPLPGDDHALLSHGEASNPLPLRSPVEPGPGSGQYRVLRALHRTEAPTVEDLAMEASLSEAQVRAAIDGLRSKAHDITNVGRCRFALDPDPRRSAA